MEGNRTPSTFADDDVVIAGSQAHQASFESVQPCQTHSIPLSPVKLPPNEAQSETPYVNLNQPEREADAISSRTPVRRDPFAHVVPEAYLVDDHDEVEDIVISGYAEPMPPWWKSIKKFVCAAFYCSCVLVTVIMLTVIYIDSDV